MDDIQSSLFEEPAQVVEAPISEYSKTLILESLEALMILGPKEPAPHIKAAMKSYFEQLKALIIVVKDESTDG